MTSPSLSEGDVREMLARLAHEIRNPLANVDSSAQLLARLGDLDESSERLVSGIRSQVKRIDEVIRAMQRFIRLDQQTASGMRIDEAVRLGLQIIAGRGRTRTSSLRVEPGPECVVLTDPNLLPAAIAEVLDNAFTFSPAGRTVTVAWSQTGTHELHIVIDDEGPGIASDIENRIIRPFFSTSTRGIGLGLNIAQRACRLLGGDLSWRNLPGRGARFVINVPCIGP
ncbi:MAG: HAMP domain-containing histidine kinase [Acidobacteria bacterium]|nr:HAMP domain-containing histidine kinase [Acidobacteriota bacterium]